MAGRDPCLAPPPGDVLGLKEGNIKDRWSPTDEPSRLTKVFWEHLHTGAAVSGRNA